MDKHAPEPWDTTYDDFICDKNGTGICQFFNKAEDDFANSEANASRIVQCVNALAGIENPEAVIRFMRSIKTDEDKVIEFGSMVDMFDNMQSENKRLREALKDIMENVEFANSTNTYLDSNEVWNIASEALKGGGK